MPSIVESSSYLIRRWLASVYFYDSWLWSWDVPNDPLEGDVPRLEDYLPEYFEYYLELSVN